ncbi:hypothetical protein CDAR_443321 [Caerostris darwini]|uniref:Uncharacterized protein n=1 Tax=Caerostris darwini TaxID=1538125 RepID=A0AAV4SIJ1_9ARAC|nr:hypothetical protein CDAR_443321 [Caerostris darwini]
MRSVRRRMSSRYSILVHVLRSMSDVTELMTSVIVWWRSLAPRTGVASTISLIEPNRKKSGGVKSGDRDGQTVGPSRLIYGWENVSSEERRTSELKCGGVPSYWNITFGCKESSCWKTNCSDIYR